MTATFIYPLTSFVEKTFVITEFELRKLRHDFTELITRALQPALWLLIFGETFNRIHAIPTGKVPYLDFLAPGIVAQSTMFVAIFYGIQIIWERDSGVLTKLLVTPTPRSYTTRSSRFSPAGAIHSTLIPPGTVACSAAPSAATSTSSRRSLSSTR